MRDRLYTTEAIILRRSDVGEADRLLTIYTPHYGKITISARGVRKTMSKLAGHLELFLHTRLQLARGRTFDVVTESRAVQPFRQLREDLDRISWAYYVSELIDKMTESGSENVPLFALLRDTMAAIDAIDEALRRDVIIRFYELHLLTLSGYRPHLFHCAQCERELGQDTDRFSPITGGALCPRCGPHEALALPMSLAAFKLLRYLARGSIDDARALAPSAATLQETGRLINAAIRQVLERELKSVVFLDLLRG
ncbi:MAG: DNA repair protein RecO [Herpetosiphonaceae bacterium]|nr:DNA repair protein RecO [Herpetosiphonaceae bacterium]